jgi:glyoxylate/hydroxypyruvate reductase A
MTDKEARRLTVLIASPLEAEHAERIAAVDPERLRVVYEPELLPLPRYEGDHHGIPRHLSDAELGRWRTLVAEADVMFDFDWLDAATLPERAPRLRWLQATSAGIGEFLAKTGLAETDIVFTTAAGVHATALAEFVILGLLYLTKEVSCLHRRQSERHWERYTARALAGQRALVVGLGEVGRETARVLDALGVEVWGLRRSEDAAPAAGVRRLVRRTELCAALEQVDALVLVCPLTPETRRLIGSEELASLGPSGMLVNVARGAVVDEEELVRALREGRLRGAVLDVFEREPLPPESPLWEFPNVLVSPHSASTVGGENRRIVDIFTENLWRYLEGEPLRNLFERERGY